MSGEYLWLDLLMIPTYISNQECVYNLQLALHFFAVPRLNCNDEVTLKRKIDSS